MFDSVSAVIRCAAFTFSRVVFIRAVFVVVSYHYLYSLKQWFKWFIVSIAQQKVNAINAAFKIKIKVIIIRPLPLVELQRLNTPLIDPG